jgi:mannose-6-phosphate isomerase-like protein (cupin superfamily)
VAALGRRLGRAAVLLPPRDDRWRGIAPGFAQAVGLARLGLPFHVVAERRHERASDPARLDRALGGGETVLFPQAHQVLPRVMRLMVALRSMLLGPFRPECSYLFVVRGRGREGMGLHHDGPVDSFWLQIQGRRQVTIGPRVPPGTPEEMDGPRPRRRGWWTVDLGPGTLFYLPPWTPHRVVHQGPSVALSLTWGSRDPRRAAGVARDAAEAARGLTDWDVVSGRADRVPPAEPGTLWAQVPAVAGPLGRGGRAFPLWTGDGEKVILPAAARPWAGHLAIVPCWRGIRPGALPPGLRILSERGLVAPRDLPLLIAPADPAALDAHQF